MHRRSRVSKQSKRSEGMTPSVVRTIRFARHEGRPPVVECPRANLRPISTPAFRSIAGEQNTSKTRPGTFLVPGAAVSPPAAPTRERSVPGRACVRHWAAQLAKGIRGLLQPIWVLGSQLCRGRDPSPFVRGASLRRCETAKDPASSPACSISAFPVGQISG